MEAMIIGAILGMMIIIIIHIVMESRYYRKRETRKTLEITSIEFNVGADKIQSVEAGIKILGDRIVIELDKPLQNIYLSVEKARILAHSLYRLSDELEPENEK